MPAQGAADARASHHGWRLHRRGRILQPRPGERRPDQARPARARRENRVCAFRRRSLVESVRRQPRQRWPHRRHGERHVHVDACGRCQRAARAPVLRGRLVPIWFETGLAPPTSAPGLGAPLPHICTGTGRTPATSAPGLSSPLPHLHWDWAHPCHICAGTGLAPASVPLPPAPVLRASRARLAAVPIRYRRVWYRAQMFSTCATVRDAVQPLARVRRATSKLCHP